MSDRGEIVRRPRRHVGAGAVVNVRAIYLGINNRRVIVTSDNERTRRALGM
jgi:hypothetical protein